MKISVSAFPRAQFAALRCGFKRAQAGGADRDDPAFLLSRALDGGHGGFRNLEAFGVHAVFGDVVHAHRLERAGADVQRQPRQVHALRSELVEQRRVEMEARRRGCHGAYILRKDRLVACFILDFDRMRDVRWEWQAPMLLDQGIQIARTFQFQREKLGGGAGAAGRPERECVFHDDPVARLRRLAGANLRYRTARIADPLDHDFDLTATFLPPEKARFDHLGVVEYQEIARLNEIGKVGEFEVAESVWFDMQQPARGA